MQSSFEVLEWESTSKEQDSLVNQLFGEISNSIATTNTAVSACEDSTRQKLNDKGNKLSKKEKRKALNNDESIEIPKKKRKDKKEKNKFKTDQKLNSQLTELRYNQSESSIDEACDDTTEKPKKKQKDKREKNKFKTYQKLNSQLTELRDDQSECTIGKCGDSISFVKGTNEKAAIDSTSVNQIKQAVSVDYLMPQNAEFEVQKSSDESIECKTKKAKKNKKKEKSKDDDANDESELQNGGQSTLETNHKGKRRKTKNEDKQDFYEPTKHHSPKLKDQNMDLVSPSVPQRKSSLREKITKQLESSRFRWINEQLYTTTGDEAVAMFSEDPNLFDVYHRGFTNQVKLWPVNPVDKIMEWLNKRPISHVVADFGCGEAIIAQSITNKVHSFDLVAKNKFVTPCNMAKVPLISASVDVAVFCLSLMGTDLVDFLREAHRVLKPGGVLKVAEVTSRINDTTEFAKSLSRLGFQLQSQDTSNKMFVLFDFIKDKELAKTIPSHKLEGLKLKPCIYKKR